jgi:hypothetical protein
MRSHGIANFPGAGVFGEPGGIRAAKGQIAQIAQRESSSQKFQIAQRACAQYYGPGTTTSHVSPEQLRKLVAVSHCMRAHGVQDFPDPNPVTGDIGTPAGIDRSSPIVLAALRACSSLGRAAGLGAPHA